MGQEIDNHEGRIMKVTEDGRRLVEEGANRSDEILLGISKLLDKWGSLRLAWEGRSERLGEAERAAKFVFDVRDAEAFIDEFELRLLSVERPRDEQGALNAVRKHDLLANTILAYEQTVDALTREAQAMIRESHPDRYSNKRASSLYFVHVAVLSLISYHVSIVLEYDPNSYNCELPGQQAPPS